MDDYGRALACALVASAPRRASRRRFAGLDHLRLDRSTSRLRALGRLADLGAIFDPELRRRCERLAGSLEVA